MTGQNYLADSEEHISELRQRVEKLADGKMLVFESEDRPVELREQFWERIVAYEEAELTTHFDELVKAGMVLTAPEELDDAQISLKLYEVIHGLALLHC